MPALVAGIRVLNACNIKGVDGRDKPGHDDGETVGISQYAGRDSERSARIAPLSSWPNTSTIIERVRELRRWQQRVRNDP
jgi:hypothetical protein